MKKFKTIILGGLFAFAFFHFSAFAAPEISLPTEDAAVGFPIAEINVTILHGMDQDGEKPYKIEYKMLDDAAAIAANSQTLVDVVYKSEADEGKYAVTEIFVEKAPNQGFAIKATIEELAPGSEEPTPEIFYIDPTEIDEAALPLNT